MDDLFSSIVRIRMLPYEDINHNNKEEIRMKTFYKLFYLHTVVFDLDIFLEEEFDGSEL